MQTFSIVSVDARPGRRRSTLKQHAADLKAATDAEKAFTEKKKEFQDANSDAIDRILKAERQEPAA